MTSKNPSITDFREDVQKCMRCGFCIAQCPVEEYMGFETNTPRGRMQTIKALLDQEVSVNYYIMNRIYNCTLCGYCQWRCPPGVKTSDAIKTTREYFVEKNCSPKIHTEFSKRIQKYNNPYAEHPEKRLSWLPSSLKQPKKSEIIYFVGCTSALRLPEIAESSRRLLEAANLDFYIMPNEVCCGSIMFRTGFREVGKKVAEKNIQMIDDMRATTILFSCPGCYDTFTNEYPELLKEPLDYELKHISEYLLEVDRLKFVTPLKAHITYHDPCHLGRHLGIYEPPREFLNRIPGVQLIEMERKKNTAFCCGAGGGVRGAFPDTSLKIAQQRAQEAIDTKGTILSSACPFCKRNLKEATEEDNTAMKVYDIVELAARSL
ncbi:(Fe-S)-binding protein [[Eubacterium] cellulosolvens]